MTEANAMLAPEESMSSNQLSPLVSLATSMHAQPGVYALLLGSGVSTGAGVLTGWGVVTELVSRVAAITGGEEAVAGARKDPQTWWAIHGDGELGYSSLLERLAPSSAAARQGLLAGFFESDANDGEPLREPSRAHRAIAELVRRGSVRVILTTNFDRLMEQALESVGVAPQVIARPEAVNGMAPLAHAPATLVKLHGDYKDLGTRNTPDELSTYPVEWTRLLEQIFDEYGVIVSGWSAEWDDALVAALESSSARRYPLYWDERSSRGRNARRLLSLRAGSVLPASSADELFGELVEDLEALDRLSSPPLTTAIAVARMKRYLPDPVRRIDLHDLVMTAVDSVIELIHTQRTGGGEVEWGALEDIYEDRFRSMEQLAQMLITGVWHDSDGTHDKLWLDVVQRLLDAGSSELMSSNDALRNARLIPAFVAVAVISVTGTRRNREGLLIEIATRVEGRNPYSRQERVPAAYLLHYGQIVQDGWANNLPRWENKWSYPTSHLFAVDIRRYFVDLIPDDIEFTEAYQGFEYRLGLLQKHTTQRAAISGEYAGEFAWRGDEPVAEIRFREKTARDDTASWVRFFETKGLSVEDALTAHREVLNKYIRW